MTSALRATALIAIFSIFSKILGLVRQATLANQFGVGREIDIYVAAFRVPDFLFNLLILGTLSVAFIPVFVGLLKQNRKYAFEIASGIFNLTFVVMGALSLLGVFLASFLVDAIVPGFGPEEKRKTVELTRILMASPLLFSLSSVLTSVLHSHKRFLLAAVAPLFYNASIIFGIFYLYPRFGLAGIGWGVVMGAFLHFMIQFPSVLALGMRPFKNFNFHQPELKKIAKLYVPRIFGMDLGQVSILIASIIGSTLGAGSLAIFYYSYDINTMPLGVLAIPFSIATFPMMADFVTKRDFRGFREFFAKTAVQIMFLIIPVSVLLLLLRAQVVRLVLGAGQNTQFNFADIRVTAQALGFFVLSMFAQSLIPILARAFYALQNTIIPVAIGLVAVGMNVVLAYVFTRFAGPDTLALAFSIAALFNMLTLFFVLHRRLGGLEDEYLFLRLIKISVASVTMGIAAYVTLYLVAPLVDMQTYFGVLIQTLCAGLVAVGTYLLAGIVIRLPEASGLVQITKSWFNKFTKPVTSAIVNMFTDFR